MLELKAYSHILVAVDFSSHSELTLQRALQMAKQYDAKLTILHTLEHKTNYDKSYEVMLNPEQSFDMDEVIFSGAEKRMTELVSEIDKDNIDTQILWGRARTVILSCAEDQQADLIVMGSHGHHGLDRLLGSTANTVINNALCDVLVVKMT